MQILMAIVLRWRTTELEMNKPERAGGCFFVVAVLETYIKYCELLWPLLLIHPFRDVGIQVNSIVFFSFLVGDIVGY